MAFGEMQGHTPEIATCRYPGSKLLFRGPARRLDGRYVACLGGCATHGRAPGAPYPARLEGALGVPCVNLGLPNAGVDVMLGDAGLLNTARGASAAVLQLPGAVNLENSFYSVHPRRNDRFIAASSRLRALYPEVDFTQFNFTRHLTGTLLDISQARFVPIAQELRRTWLTRMRRLIALFDAPVILLWVSSRHPDEDILATDPVHDPALVTREMVYKLHAVCAGMVHVATRLPDAAEPPGAITASDLYAPSVSERLARKLAPTVRTALNRPRLH